MWKRAAMLGTTASAVMVAGLALAAPASASSRTNVYTSGTLAGYGQLVSDAGSGNELFYACDEKTDGRGVQVDWYVVSNPSNSGSVWDGSGNDNVCAGQYASIGEGNAVNYRVCLTDNGSIVACTGWVRDHA